MSMVVLHDEVGKQPVFPVFAGESALMDIDAARRGRLIDEKIVESAHTPGRGASGEIIQVLPFDIRHLLSVIVY